MAVDDPEAVRRLECAPEKGGPGILCIVVLLLFFGLLRFALGLGEEFFPLLCASLGQSDRGFALEVPFPLDPRLEADCAGAQRVGGPDREIAVLAHLE